VIRLFSLSDLEAVTALAVLHSGGDEAEWAESLTADFTEDQRVLMVVELDQRVVAYGKARCFKAPPDCAEDVAPDGYYLSGLVVDPRYRRRGVGTALTRGRLMWIRVRAPEAWYFTDSNNLASLELHERLGFRETSRDFTFPGVGFDGGTGVLSRLVFAPRGSRQPYQPESSPQPTPRPRRPDRSATAPTTPCAPAAESADAALSDQSSEGVSVRPVAPGSLSQLVGTWHYREENDSVSALDLVDAWAASVTLIYQEAQWESWPDHARHRVSEDLFAALLKRTTIQNVLDRVDPAVDVPPAIQAIDELLRAATADDPERIMVKLGESLQIDPGPRGYKDWWWARIPVRGPIAHEIQNWLREPGG
jgi:ribosomal protein S18 acetylase RimI-like enzyme